MPTTALPKRFSVKSTEMSSMPYFWYNSAVAFSCSSGVPLFAFLMSAPAFSRAPSFQMRSLSFLTLSKKKVTARSGSPWGPFLTAFKSLAYFHQPKTIIARTTSKKINFFIIPPHRPINSPS